MMRISKILWLNLTAIFVLLIGTVSPGFGSESSSLRPLRTELVVAGDDGLTQRFADALDTALRSSPKFTMVPVTSPHDVRLFLAGNIDWTKTNRGLSFYIVVVFTDIDEHFLGVYTGECLESEMKICADKVLRDAYINGEAASNSSSKRTREKPRAP